MATILTSTVGLARVAPRDQGQECEGANRCEGDDEIRCKPVLHEASVQYEFERAQERGYEQETYPIEADLIGRFPLLHQHGDERHHNDADGSIDKEVPVPGIVIGEPAAKDRPDHRRHDYCNPGEGEGLTALWGREGICKDGLRHRHHPAAPKPLQDTEQKEGRQIPGQSAEHRA